MPTVGGNMDHRRIRLTVYESVQKALMEATRNQPSSRFIEQVLSTVRTAFDDACADFAETWNNRGAGAIAERFPAEVLTMCFHNAPFATRVNASHVSRKWRALALSDRSLWASFRRTVYPACSDPGKLLIQLSVMLKRSRPCPFTLHLPEDSLGSPIVAILSPDFGRLQEFNGPIHLFQKLNPTGAPTPCLESLRLVSERSTNPHCTFDIPLDWAVRCVPRLRRLELHGPTFAISPACFPSTSLTHICFSAEGEYTHLFRWCPNLVSLDLRGVLQDTALPAVPLPPNLSVVALAASGSSVIEFGSLLAAWAGHRIPHLTVFSAASLAQPLNILLSSYRGPLEVDMARNRVDITSCMMTTRGPCHTDWRYVVYPYSWKVTNHLRALRGACAARLTSISVPLDHFGLFFSAQLEAPVLLSLAFTFTGGCCESSIPQLPSPEFCLAAPQLQDVALYLPRLIPREDAACWRAFDALRFHLRDLVVYNAPLVHKITVRGGPVLMANLGCADLAQYAQSYAEIALL